MHSRSQLTFLVVNLLVATAGLATDPNDWVNIKYVLTHAGDRSSGETASAQANIVSNAGATAKKGPWTVTDSPVKAPSGDPHDYLSWAPYHWPNCNWCEKGTNHFANPNSTEPDIGDGSGDSDFPDDGDYEGGGVTTPDSEQRFINGFDGTLPILVTRNMQGAHRRMRRVRRHGTPVVEEWPPSLSRRGSLDPFPDFGGNPITDAPALPTAPLVPNLGGSRTGKGAAGTPAPAQAPAKTQKAASKCTPSPTKPLAPSATWTTCPYEVRDGKVNPDVRSLTDSSDVMNMAQAVLYNGIAYALNKAPIHSKNAASLIDTWFLSPATAMNPNMNYGQQVRGPGKEHQYGTFTGILDLRALVKVVNAIQLLRVTKSPDWTSAREQAMTSWTKTYIAWLQGSKIGKETASKANNHFTFYVSQLAAAQMLVGDNNGATNTLSNYFTHQFLDQVAASGEQPFEAVRTRPFHYRAFNLEAMITNAKLGDQLGQNFWIAKSKYGATIQNAVDFAMAQDPKSEDISDVFPHVASAAAAYGDPNGKYKKFLSGKSRDYQSQAFYFYDQTDALPNSPAAARKKKRDVMLPVGNLAIKDASNSTTCVVANGLPAIPFECPDVFGKAPLVELEDGLFVSCDDLRRFYEGVEDCIR